MGNTPVAFGNETVIIEKELGSGGFGKLFLAHPQTNPSVSYALKSQPYFDQKRLDQIKKEVALQRKCSSNQFVCKLFKSAAFTTPRHEVLMLMEYCPTSLVQILERTYPNPLQESYVLGIFYQIGHALCYLHSQNPRIVHRDIKVENVLFSQDRKFKLIDFGSATFESEIARKQGDCGIVEEEISRMTTLAYRSPEMIDLYSYMEMGCKIDVWALGCLIFKCLTFTTPFDESPMKIQCAKYTLPNCSPFMQDLLKMCFVINPTQRADSFQILNTITQSSNLPNPYSNLVTPWKSPCLPQKTSPNCVNDTPKTKLPPSKQPLRQRTKPQIPPKDSTILSISQPLSNSNCGDRFKKKRQFVIPEQKIESQEKEEFDFASKNTVSTEHQTQNKIKVSGSKDPHCNGTKPLPKPPKCTKFEFQENAFINPCQSSPIKPTLSQSTEFAFGQTAFVFGQTTFEEKKTNYQQPKIQIQPKQQTSEAFVFGESEFLTNQETKKSNHKTSRFSIRI
ncbi:non-specific serine/threonine protein kinase [Entamoeba marina]